MIDQLYETVRTQLAENDFLSGGAVLMAIGGAVALLRSTPSKIWSWVKRRIFLDVELTNSDKAYMWIEQWLAKQPYCRDRARWLSLRTIWDGDERKIIMTPAPGTHWLFWKRRLIIINKDRKEVQGDNSFNMKVERETLTISLLGRKRQAIMSLLEEVRAIAEPPKDDRVPILIPSYQEWQEQAQRRPRALESVILPEGVSENLVKDIETFLVREEWYFNRGIPWRRGYLLYGPPGSGKSSLVFALASHLKMKLATLNLSGASNSDNDLSDLLSDLPPRTILLIEDIDCVFDQREATKDKENRVTFSGLLNAIDGVAASEGTILFMTTNHIEKLDEALVRPGRCDVKQYIGPPEKEQVKRMYERFFPSTDGTHFAEALYPPPSMAAIQGHLIQYSNEPEKALWEASKLMEAA